MKKESARMNAWWFCSPTQLLILRKERKDYLKKKETGFSFLFPPPAVREPHFQGASIQHRLRTLKHIQRSFIAFYRKVIGTSQ